MWFLLKSCNKFIVRSLIWHRLFVGRSYCFSLFMIHNYGKRDNSLLFFFLISLELSCHMSHFQEVTQFLYWISSTEVAPSAQRRNVPEGKISRPKTSPNKSDSIWESAHLQFRQSIGRHEGGWRRRGGGSLHHTVECRAVPPGRRHYFSPRGRTVLKASFWYTRHIPAASHTHFPGRF